MFLQAEEITLTIGQAFELAYKKFLESNRTFEFPTQFFREIIASYYSYHLLTRAFSIQFFFRENVASDYL